MLKLGEMNTKLYLGDTPVKKAYFGEQLVYETTPTPEVIPSTLNECSWDLISQLSQTGEFSEYFSVGDTKTIILNGQIGDGFTADNLTIDLVVVGINHNAEVEGDNLVHFMMGQVNGINVALVDNNYFNSFEDDDVTYFTINVPRTNVGGWISCQMREKIIGGNGTPLSPTEKTLMAALPLDLRKVMRQSEKWTDNYGQGNTSRDRITKTLEYLCLIDEYENLGTTTFANPYVSEFQKKYEYFYQFSTPVSFKRCTDQGLNENVQAANIYFRGPSPYSGNRYWDGTSTNGKSDYVSGNYSRGIPVLLFV